MTNGLPSIRFGETVVSMQNNIGVLLHDFGFNQKRPRVLCGTTLAPRSISLGPQRITLGFAWGGGGVCAMVYPVRVGNVFNVV